jgi:hypothetical protein
MGGKLEFFRKMVETYVERRQFTTALYWADKVGKEGV